MNSVDTERFLSLYTQRSGVVPVKISSFTWSEEWQVWITRFEAIAERKGRSGFQLLDTLFPRIEGQAAYFVFSQLHQAVLHGYSELKAELNNRYKVTETTRL